MQTIRAIRPALLFLCAFTAIFGLVLFIIPAVSPEMYSKILRLVVDFIPLTLVPLL